MSNKKKPIEITENTARMLYKTATPEFKAALEDTYGKEFFQQGLPEVINDFVDILEATGNTCVPDFSDLPERYRDHFKKYFKVVIMVEAYNRGQKMDIYDEDTLRHYPYFKTNGSPSGFAFRGSGCDYAIALAGSGSRLSFREEKHSDDAGTKFKQIFQEYLES
jgi:hypothetical protein